MHSRCSCALVFRRRRGAVVVWAAFCLVIVVGFLALAVDSGFITLTQSELQNAADAGALSGARALAKGRDSAINAVQKWAAKNIAAGKKVAIVAAEDVEVGKWDDATAAFTPLSALSNQSPNAIRVTCRRTASRGNPLGLFFAPVIGVSNSDVIATAVAKLKTSRCGLIIGLSSVSMSGGSHTDSYSSASGPYSAAAASQSGHVCSNGDITMSGSSAIYGDAHPGEGKIVKSSSSIGVSGETASLSDPISYPPAEPGDAGWNNDNASIPRSLYNKDPLNGKGEFSLSGGDRVDLSPGTYYFSKLTLSGGSILGVTGASKIYVTGDVNLSGGSVANTTMLPENLHLFPMGSKCVISGSSEFYGVVYGSTAQITRSGESGFFGALIGASLVLSGGGGIHADLALDVAVLGVGVQRSVLVQ